MEKNSVRLTFFLFDSLFYLFVFLLEVSRCGPHEHFEQCARPISCQRSCNESSGKMCASVCTPTCVCEDGRVRNNLNECVHANECRRRPL
jgi:hypothetical protein